MLLIPKDDCSNLEIRVIISDMRVEFFDNPLQEPRSREEIRFNQLGLYVFEDNQRLAVGFDITPFQDRPSIDVSLANSNGVEEASMSIIEAMQSNFSLTMHLPEQTSESLYQIQAILYYRTADGDRHVVDTIRRDVDMGKIGEQ